MEREDIYIKEALSILKENNSYFKRVYSSSADSPNSFNIMIGDNLYFFIMNIPSPTGNFGNILFDEILKIDNVDPNESITLPGLSGYTGAKPIGELGKIYEKDDASFLLSEIEKIASSKPVDTPDTSDTTDTTETIDTEGTTDKKDKSDTSDKAKFFIYKFTVHDRTEGAKPKEFVTSVTNIPIESYETLIEYYGYIVDHREIVKYGDDAQELYQHVPNNAITPKNIKPAPGAVIKSYYIRITWGQPENKKIKTFHTVSTFWDKFHVEKLFKERLEDKLSEDEKKEFVNLNISVREAEDKSRFGSFNFNEVSPLILRASSIGLLHPQAYQISCLDTEGDPHKFITVKSNVSIDEYIHKLRIIGFNNIKAEPSTKSGNIKIDDIEIGFDPSKSKNIFQKFFRPK